MPYADSNRTSIRVIEETTWGTTPTTGITREVRLTSSAIAATKDTVVSDELRSDRMVSNISEVGAAAGGDINFEFSAGAQDEFLAAFMLGAWTRPMTRDQYEGIILSVTSTTVIQILGVDATLIFPAGRRFVTKNFLNAANNGYFAVTSVAFSGGNTQITVTGAGFVVEAAGASLTAALYDANDVIVLNDITISSTATGFSSTGTPYTSAIAAGQLVIGQKIFVDGLAGAKGYYTVTGLANNLITTSPAPTAVVAAGTSVNIKGSLLRNPSVATNIAQRKFSIETGFTDVAQYFMNTGMVPGSFSLELKAGAIVTGAIGFQGRGTSIGTVTVLNTGPYTPLPAQTGEVVNATTNVGTMTKNGVALTSAIQSLSIKGDANLRTQSAIATKFARGIGTGRFTLTGSLMAYFEDAVMFNHFLAHDTVSLSFTVTDSDGQAYIYTLPAVKFTADKVTPSGIDQDIFNAVEFTAFRDPITGCMLQVDRFSPAK